MALSNDQRAMLRLLAQREQGYEDIAALMGLSVDQVRAKVREALEQIDSEEATPEAAPAPAAPAATEAPKVEAPAAMPSPTAPDTPPSAAPKASPSPRRSRKIPLPSGRRRSVEWLGGIAIVALIVLFATGTIDLGGGSDSDSEPTTAAGAPDGGTAAAAADLAGATKAILTPVRGGQGAGLALFGRIKKTPILQVEAKGLEPSPKGQSYTVWLYRSPKVVLRVGAVAVPRNGTIAAQFPLPAQVLGYVAGGAFDQIDISLTQNAAYEAEVAQAEKQKRLPAYTGIDILRGKITGPGIKKPGE